VGQDPEQLRAEIARTRAELGQDLDTLVEKVTPSKVVERKVDATKEAVVGVKDKIMGSAGSAKDSVMGSASDAGGSVAGTASSAGSSVAGAAGTAVDGVTSAAQQAPQTAKRKAAGNPVAAGVIAFGLGWLISGLLPQSEAEQKGASKIKDKALDAAEPLKEQAAQAASEIKENLAPAAQDAVSSVKETATGAVTEVKDQAAWSGATVTDQASTSASSVADTAKTAAQDAKEQATTPPEPEPSSYAVVVEEPIYVEETSAFPMDPVRPAGGSPYADDPALRPPN